MHTSNQLRFWLCRLVLKFLCWRTFMPSFEISVSHMFSRVCKDQKSNIKNRSLCNLFLQKKWSCWLPLVFICFVGMSPIQKTCSVGSLLSYNSWLTSFWGYTKLSTKKFTNCRDVWKIIWSKGSSKIVGKGTRHFERPDDAKQKRRRRKKRTIKGRVKEGKKKGKKKLKLFLFINTKTLLNYLIQISCSIKN